MEQLHRFHELGWETTTENPTLPSQSLTKLTAIFIDGYNPFDGVLGFVARNKANNTRYIAYHPSVVALRSLLIGENKIADVCSHPSPVFPFTLHSTFTRNLLRLLCVDLYHPLRKLPLNSRKPSLLTLNLAYHPNEHHRARTGVGHRREVAKVR